MIDLSTVKKLAASTAIAGALSVAGLGLAMGIAAAAPADHAEVHAHLIPGFAPKPAHTPTASSLGSTDNGWGDGDACHEPRCVEVIDE
jgi:hypothetical protein